MHVCLSLTDVLCVSHSVRLSPPSSRHSLLLANPVGLGNRRDAFLAQFMYTFNVVLMFHMVREYVAQSVEQSFTARSLPVPPREYSILYMMAMGRCVLCAVVLRCAFFGFCFCCHLFFFICFQTLRFEPSLID